MSNTIMFDFLSDFKFAKRVKAGKQGFNKGFYTSLTKCGLSKNGEQRYAFVISMTPEVVKKMGLKIGDKINPGFQTYQDEKYIMIDKDEKGWALSSNDRDGKSSCAVKIMKNLVPDGYDGFNVSSDEITEMVGKYVVRLGKKAD